MKPNPQTSRRRWIVGGLAGLLLALSSGLTAEARTLRLSPSPAPLGEDHKHNWVERSQRVWVEPVIRKVQVGKDKNGKPIFENRVVQQGYYRVEIEKRCKKCGKVK